MTQGKDNGVADRFNFSTKQHCVGTGDARAYSRYGNIFDDRPKANATYKVGLWLLNVMERQREKAAGRG